MSQGFPTGSGGGFGGDPTSSMSAPTTMSTPPTMPGPIAPYPATGGWPKIIGILSIVFGGLGVLQHACYTLSSFSSSLITSLMPTGQAEGEMFKKLMEKNATPLMISGVLYIILTGLSVLLIVAGVKTLSRSASGATFHKLWAIGKIIVSVIMMFPAYIMMQNQFELMREMGATGGGAALPGAGFFGAIGIFGVIFGLLFACAYPVFLLIWFNRFAVKSQVATWKA
jgi:hypothetical protein